MSRDSSGNYTLPAGVNPVITGTTITSSWANTTMNDLATEMTDSLSRSGKGAMNAALKILDGSVSAPGLAFGSELGTGLYRIGAGNPGFAVTGVKVWEVNSSKQWILQAIDNQAAAIFNDNTLTSGFWNEYQNAGVARGRIGTGTALFTGAATGDFGIVAVTGTLRLGVGSGAAVTALSIASTGDITVAAPTSGIALTVNGLANQQAAMILGSSTSGQSIGLEIRAGTTTADNALIVRNQAAGTPYFAVQGNGEIFIQAPPAYSGTGTQFQIGYLDMPLNVQAASYQLALTDRGKAVDLSGASLTLTIPANSVTAFPVGTTIFFFAGSANAVTVALATDTLRWLPTNTTGSPRTIAGWGFCTLYKRATTEWLIWGQGIS